MKRRYFAKAAVLVSFKPAFGRLEFHPYFKFILILNQILTVQLPKKRLQPFCQTFQLSIRIPQHLQIPFRPLQQFHRLPHCKTDAAGRANFCHHRVLPVDEFPPQELGLS